jgi:thiamine biosynthesis lipoprotein
LVERAIKISKIKGAFDISYASMDKIWKFDGSNESDAYRKKLLKISSKNCYQTSY